MLDISPTPTSVPAVESYAVVCDCDIKLTDCLGNGVLVPGAEDEAVLTSVSIAFEVRTSYNFKIGRKSENHKIHKQNGSQIKEWYGITIDQYI